MSEAAVLFDYNAEADDELTLKEGDLIKNINKKEDGWWEGVLHGKRGMFPENFVKEIKRSVPESKQEKSVDKPTVSSGKTAIAKVTFDYEAENEDELSLKEGEIVEVLSQEEEGWWKGSLNGKVGVFPANFVEIEKGVSVPKPLPAPITSANEEPVVKETPEKRAKAIGGVGFGGILTQDALSGIKLRKNKSGAQLNPVKKPEQPTEQSELRKKLSMKRNPPRHPDQDKHIKPSKSKGKAIVEFDYEKEQNDELTLCVGDVVNILEGDVNEGWARGELNGKIGLFPDNFVKLLPPEQPSKQADISKGKDNEGEEMDAPKNEDMVDTKPSRPELPVPPKIKKPGNERPPAPLPVSHELGHPELPIGLKPVPNSKPDEILKKTETSLFESKPATEEKPPVHVRHEKPSPKKSSPPLLPKKPDKPKLPGDGKDRPSSPPQLASKKPPPVILRHQNGLDNNPTRRFSTGPISELNPKPEIKRHSQGSELTLNLNDIKSSGILQPLTSDRPKNTAKSPPTKYVRPHSPKKVPTTEVQKNEFNETELFKESRETKKPAEKPKKPAVLESSKPKTESMVDSNVVKKLQDQINILKESVESIAKQFKEHVEKSEKKFQKTEKKLIDEIEDLTKELDEEKKSRSAVEVEVKRLTKLIKNQQAS